jgi:long-chain acyl-CoA synthetase
VERSLFSQPRAPRPWRPPSSLTPPQIGFRASLDEPFGGHPALDALLEESPAAAPPERRGAFLFYSSGTTGRPKGIKPPLPSTPARDGDPLLDAIGSLWHAGPSSVYLSPAPLHHAAPLRTSTMMLEAGASVVCLERFDPEQALEAIATTGVTVSQWVPTMFIRMLRLPQETRDSYDLSSHRRAIHAAAPCPVWVKEQMIAWWGPIIAEYYAGSENIGTTFLESDEWLRHKGSVGRATQGEVHICDDTGAEVEAGVDGLVYFDHPDTSFDYHGDPAKTADMFHPSKPWRTLGDIGHVDEEGYLYLTDRATFMIISGGANIYPREIEDVLSEHPLVADVAVIGIPDDDLGERPLAIVQPTDTDASPEQICPALLALCRDRLAAFKIPVRIELSDSLPRGEDGKLRKLALRSIYPN